MTDEQKRQQTVEWVTTGLLLLLGFYNHLALILNWPHLEVVDTEVTKLVDWTYSLVIGVYAFWKNNNITSPAQLVQVLLNKLKSGKVSVEQIDVLMNVVGKLQAGELTAEQLEEFIGNQDLKEITQAHVDGQTVEVNIKEGV